jgi:hypothetical protein
MLVATLAGLKERNVVAEVAYVVLYKPSIARVWISQQTIMSLGKYANQPKVIGSIVSLFPFTPVVPGCRPAVKPLSAINHTNIQVLTVQPMCRSARGFHPLSE